MTIILESKRLRLRKLVLQDASFILKLLNSPTWLQFIGDRDVKSVADAQSYLVNGPLMSYAALGYGLWLIEFKENAIPVGMCGLLKRPYLDYADIGYALLPEHAGYGYATEIVEATARYAFANLGMDGIAAITTTANSRSINVLKKTGFKYKGPIADEQNREMLLYIRDAHTPVCNGKEQVMMAVRRNTLTG